MKKALEAFRQQVLTQTESVRDFSHGTGEMRECCLQSCSPARCNSWDFPEELRENARVLC